MPDAATLYANATAADAHIVGELEEMSYGGKSFSCRDPEGHLWSIGDTTHGSRPGTLASQGCRSRAHQPQDHAKLPPHQVPWYLLGMEPNPYAAHLGSGADKKDPRAVLSSTPGLVHQAACALTPEQLATPIAPGKWSPCQIVAHLADCEIAFSFRLRQTLAAPAAEPHEIQPFDQTAWSQHYFAYDIPSALELFRALRSWNLKLIGSLSQADLARPASHPERGELTFQTILETMAGHDLNHLVQLQRLTAS